MAHSIGIDNISRRSALFSLFLFLFFFVHSYSLFSESQEAKHYVNLSKRFSQQSLPRSDARQVWKGRRVNHAVQLCSYVWFLSAILFIFIIKFIIPVADLTRAGVKFRTLGANLGLDRSRERLDSYFVLRPQSISYPERISHTLASHTTV